MKPFYFTKKDGKLSGNFAELPDGTYTAKKPSSQRSIQQNRLYWGWFLKHIVKFHEDRGEVYTVEQMHEAFKKSLLKKRIYNQVGNKRKWIQEIGSTSDLNTKQFKEYMEKINKMYLDATADDENGPWCVPECPNEEELLYWEKMIV